ncbi:hypothetical protein [Colwellia psychrerythraea]|uniref:Lipoprotein n=1 Tax=Colwellia psychrerythraea TaxID=28229 RepID=A0A099L6S1_COLPS|nr:hypothetical protein [Colwellia psychrerythraea]KGJ97583.1 hypothetical protein GAB14E_1172 [Colwellia psychrerythraea]
MKYLLTMVLVLTLTACGSSSDDSAPVTPEPLPPIVEPSPEPPVADPIEPVVPPVIEPIPPVECTTDCDVYLDPIEVIVEPIEGGCFIVPTLSHVDEYTVHIDIVNTCLGTTVYFVPPETIWDAIEITPKMIGNVVIEHKEHTPGILSSFARKAVYLDNGNLFARADATSYSNGNYTFSHHSSTYMGSIELRAYYYADSDTTSFNVRDIFGIDTTCEISAQNIADSHCVIDNVTYGFGIDWFENMPMATNLTEDYAHHLYTAITEYFDLAMVNGYLTAK